MTKLVFGTFTSSKGNTFQTLPLSVVCEALNKALGVSVGAIGVRGDSVILFPPRAPKSKAQTQDERASKGAASPGVSLQDMQAQMAALMALVQGMAPQSVPAPAAKGRRKAG